MSEPQTTHSSCNFEKHEDVCKGAAFKADWTDTRYSDNAAVPGVLVQKEPLIHIDIYIYVYTYKESLIHMKRMWGAAVESGSGR